jgi:toxin CptA
VQFPIDIELRRSRLLFVLTVSLHALAAGSLLLLPWPPWPRYLLLATLVLSAWWTWQPSKVVGLQLAASGDLTCLLAGGGRLSPLVQPDSVVFKQLVVLRVRDRETGRIDSLALLPDSMSAAQFRLLRLWLRWRVDASDRCAGGA